MVIEESMVLSMYVLFGGVLIVVGVVSFNVGVGVGVGRRSISRAGAESVGLIGSHFYGWLEQGIKIGQFKANGSGQ